MRRFMLTVVGAMVAVMLMATAALAHITSFDIDNTAVLHNPDQVRVTGTIQCTAGEVFGIRLVLEQPNAYGTGFTRGTCTGSPQQWSMLVTAERGGFQPGPAQAFANVSSDERGATGHRDELRYTEVIELVPGQQA